jgi:diphthamide synthase (EF-2-diphthine--ammonia ligase)
VPGLCAISWSAGKDSWLALMRAREQGLRVDTFVTMCDEDGTSKSHALAPALVEAQVRALGGTPVSIRVPPGEYAARFDAASAPDSSRCFRYGASRATSSRTSS